MKLKTKIFITHLLIGVLPLILMGVYANIHLEEDKFQSIKRFFTDQLVQIDFSISSFLQEVAYDVESMTVDPIIRTKDDSDFTSFLEADESSFIYSIGSVESQIIDQFSSFRNTRPYANSVYMGRENGSFVRSHPRARATMYDPRERPWYRLAESNPDMVMRTDPYQSVTTEDVNIGTVKALVDEKGDIFGVVGVDITLNNLTDFVSQIKTEEDSYIFLIDKRGIILSNPDRDRRFKFYMEAGLTDFKTVMENESGYLFFEDRGIKNIVFFHTSPMLGWKICAVVPSVVIENEMSHFTNVIIFILVFVFLTVLLNIIYFSKKTIGPITVLLKKIAALPLQLKEQRTFEKLPISGQDEIADLMAAFNNMGKELFEVHNKLEEQSQNLDRIVIQRTEALKLSEEALKSVITSMDDLLFVLNKENIFVNYYQPSTDFKLYAPSEVFIGKSLNETMPPDIAISAEKAINAVKATGHSQKFNYMLPVKGQKKWYSANVSRRNDPKGDFAGVTVVVRDITDLKEIEQDLKISKEKAEDANKAKSEFLANMSHEIRTPMNAIIGFSEIMYEKEENPEKKDNLRIVKTSGKNLLTLINDILDFSKIEAGKIDIGKSDFNLEATLDHLYSMYKRKADDIGLDFNTKIEKPVPEVVNGDEHRIIQILTNIIGNALKFTEKGSITIDCSYLAGSAVIKVTDTGIGIPADKLEAVFSAFSQADSSTERKYGGTGLGLAISRRLAELLGGSLTATSTEGEGSAFTLELPLPEGARQIEDSQSRNPDTIHTEAAEGSNGDIIKSISGYTILVAEDNRINQLLVQSLLKELNLDCDIAENGREVIEKLKDKHYDLLLLDMQMPVMDGLEVIGILRQDKRWVNLPVIALTANAIKGDEEKFLEAGCDDYISKPIDREKFQQKITVRLED